MKIIIVNGSPRKNGATAQTLYEMQRQLEQYSNVSMEVVHVADFELKYCAGCGEALDRKRNYFLCTHCEIKKGMI